MTVLILVQSSLSTAGAVDSVNRRASKQNRRFRSGEARILIPLILAGRIKEADWFLVRGLRKFAPK